MISTVVNLRAAIKPLQLRRKWLVLLVLCSNWAGLRANRTVVLQWQPQNPSALAAILIAVGQAPLIKPGKGTLMEAKDCTLAIRSILIAGAALLCLQ